MFRALVQVDKIFAPLKDLLKVRDVVDIQEEFASSYSAYMKISKVPSILVCFEDGIYVFLSQLVDNSREEEHL